MEVGGTAVERGGVGGAMGLVRGRAGPTQHQRSLEAGERVVAARCVNRLL